MDSRREGTIIEQLSIEAQMRSLGRDRYLQRQSSLTNLALSKTHGRFMDSAVDTVRNKLQDYKTEIENKPEHLDRPQWYSVLLEIDLDLLSYLALTTCMESVGHHWSRSKFLIRIGMRIEMEYYSALLRDYDKDLHKRLTIDAQKRHSSMKQRKDYVSSVSAKEGFEYSWWSNEKRTKMAQPLINAVLEGCDIFETYTQTEGGKDIIRLGFTQAMSDMIAEADFIESWNFPVLMPTIVEPKGWKDLDGGCYIDPAMSKFTPLVRKSNALQRSMIKTCINGGRFNNVFDAINAIQRTPMTINSYVLEAVEWCWDQGLHPNDNFPQKYKQNPIEFPTNYESLSDTEKKKMRLRAREVVENNRKVDSDITVFKSDIAVAKQMDEYEQFYLPHNFDWRGRVYPIPTFNHHREDHIRSMFLLTRQKPMDDNAARWVAIQAANAADFKDDKGRRISKMTLEDRIAWTENNQDWILKCGCDYKSTYDLWSKCDKPFAFLAAAHELYNYVESDGEYLCGLPIALDGTNSGTQHFAALGLNENDGMLVNLVPSELPNDIYQVVADKVLTSMTNDKSDEAKEWLNYGITRKTVKRPTMTFGYSATKIGFRQQIEDDTIRPLKREIVLGERDKMPFSNDYKACRCMAEHTWLAVNDTVKGAAEGMGFFKDLSAVLAEHELPVVWYTPIGFPVANIYNPKTVRRVHLFLYDRDLKCKKKTLSNVGVENNKRLDKKRIRSSISPNVIHSLDSSHLLSTVLAGLQDDIRDFMLIHDSFASTPADTSKLFGIVRKTFIDQYKDVCIYSNILASSTKKLPESKKHKLPSIPAKGNLDLDNIRSCLYCFS